ncbi:glycosyltransferase [Polaribacter porphyrae]|uniref:glycosyltransferase n=1 Tax=Polaribacter porphyrae TaxID=1137780 RepID=UPI001CFFB14A|nr:glycosyltransferase [Polaribacter porphyrae]
MNTTLLQVFSMCNAFVTAGYEVTLAMQKNENFENNLKDFINNSFKNGINFEIKTWNQKSKNLFINRFLVKRNIVQLVKLNVPDIIFSRDSFVLNALTKFNVPLIFESHNSKLHTGHNILHKFLEKRLLRVAKSSNFKCLFSISESLSKHWEQKGIPQRKLFAWHDGFDTSLFEKHIDINTAKSRLKLPTDKTIVTYTGGLYPSRGIENIVYLAKDFPDVDFLVIGGPEKNRQNFQKLSLEDSVLNINFMGYVEHNLVPHYLYASDILLALWSSKVPTINYCSPLKIFEYMAAGRTIVAHGFPTIREVLENEKDSILCQPDDFDSLKSSLSKALIAKDIFNYGEIVREKAFKLYSWDNRVKKLLKFIQNQ